MEDQHAPATPSHRMMERFIRLSKMQRAVIASRIRQTGVYQSQHQILMHIAGHPDASQKDIARMHEVSTATIAVALKKLESAGYISREVDRSDNRCNRLQVTEKGQKIVRQSHKILRKAEEEMFAGFGEEDFRCLERLLDRLCQNMEEMSGNGIREVGERDGQGSCPESFPGEKEAGYPDAKGPARSREREGST